MSKRDKRPRHILCAMLIQSHVKGLLSGFQGPILLDKVYDFVGMCLYLQGRMAAQRSASRYSWNGRHEADASHMGAQNGEVKADVTDGE
jgi:hypothetical protein